MTNSRRIVEISLPAIRWKFVFLGLFFFTLLALGSYWWSFIRPYFKIEKAVLHSSTLQLVAAESGKIEEYPFNEGEKFLQGEQLLSINRGLLLAQKKLIDTKINSCRERLQEEKERVDRTMQLFVQAQSEIELGIGMPGAFDAVLNEVQDAQEREMELEEELSSLLKERSQFDEKIEEQTIRAPYEGMVLRRFKQVGEFANAGEPVLLVCNLKERWVEASIPEKLLGSIHVGSVSIIEFSSFPGKSWKGTIDWIGPLVEQGTVKVRLKAENLPLQPGLSAKAKIRIR